MRIRLRGMIVASKGVGQKCPGQGGGVHFSFSGLGEEPGGGHNTHPRLSNPFQGSADIYVELASNSTSAISLEISRGFIPRGEISG